MGMEVRSFYLSWRVMDLMKQNIDAMLECMMTTIEL